MRISRTIPPAVALVALTACSTAQSVSTPASPVAPTYQCTPIFGGAVTPCSQAERDQLATRQATYAEAERIYRESVALSWKLMGDKQLATEELLSTATGDFRKGTIKSLRENQTSDVTISGAEEITWMKPADLAKNGSTLAMRACVGPGTVKIITPEGPAADAWLMESVYFKKIDNKLLISNMTAEVSDPC